MAIPGTGRIIGPSGSRSARSNYVNELEYCICKALSTTIYFSQVACKFLDNPLPGSDLATRTSGQGLKLAATIISLQE